MGKILGGVSFLVLLFCVQGAIASLPQPVSRSLEQNWNQEITEPRLLSDSGRKALQARSVLFFGGILNELARLNSSYFTDSLEALDELGVSNQYFGPWSYKSPLHNIEALRQEIENRHATEGKPLVLIGHSKGGVELLYTVLTYPHLILSGMVERVVLLQTPVGGSPLAEEEQWSWLMRWVSVSFKEGLKFLGRKHAKAALDQQLSRFHKTLERTYGYLGNAAVLEKERQVSDAIYYVRGRHLAESFSAGLSVVLTVVWDSLDRLGENDGLVLTEDQRDQRIGKDLGILDADHLTVVISGAFSNGTAEDRKAFTRALLYQLYP